MKALYRQRVPESSCARKQTVDIDILVTSRNGDRKIMQSIRITCRPSSRENKEVEPIEPVQLNTYKSNTCRKDLSWLHFNNEPRVQERQQVKEQQSCVSVFVAYITILSSNSQHQPRHGNSILCMVVCYIYRDTEQPQEKETS